MSKRARYDGPGGRTVFWFDEDGNQQTAEVESGHLLPEEVPVSVRDSLIEQGDWTEVKQSSGGQSAKKEG